MITRLTGILERLDGQLAEIAVPQTGLTYEVIVPGYLTPTLLGKLGEQVTLTTRHHLEGQGQGTSFIPRLLGFGSPADRAFFEVFTSVKGLGPKKSMKALAQPPAAVASAIARRDVKWLQELPEIGKRLAETIIAELSGKIERFAGEAVMAEAAGRSPQVQGKPVRRAGPTGDAIATLVALGDTPEAAERRVERALKSSPELADAGAIVAAALAGVVGE